jgi:hypothetical protein
MIQKKMFQQHAGTSQEDRNQMAQSYIKKRLWKGEDNKDFPPTDSYKMETMPAEGSHFTDQIKICFLKEEYWEVGLKPWFAKPGIKK